MPIKITLNASAAKAVADAAAKGGPVTLTFDASKIVVAAERLTGMFEKIGDAAQEIGNAAPTTSPLLRQSRRWLAWGGAARFAALIARLFGRRAKYE